MTEYFVLTNEKPADDVTAEQLEALDVLVSRLRIERALVEVAEGLGGVVIREGGVDDDG